MKPLDADRVSWAAQLACLLEVSAHKPGNVTPTVGFRDMQFTDLVASAVAIGPAMGRVHTSSVGQAILEAIRDTRRFVATNTNLGMVLLLVPLARAACTGHPDGFRPAVLNVLDKLTVDDARHAFEAIRIASPGGRGRSETMDVRETHPEGTLRDAMCEARERDAVAREYATCFEITFAIGCPTLADVWRRGGTLSDAIVQTALTVLARIPDTLIARKEGFETAQQVSKRAQRVLDAGGVFSQPGREAIEAFDLALRDDRHRLNPGTTADLTTASIFVFLVEQELGRVQELLHRW